MGNRKATSERRGGSPREHKRRTEKARVQSKVKKGIKVVKKELGVTEMKHGPLKELQTKKGTKDVRALKLSGTKGGTSMFGSEVSQETNKYLVSIGEATFNSKTGGYVLTSKGREMKYGKSQGAMGSGDPSGMMTSIPISESMFEQQKKIQTLALAGLSLAVPVLGGTMMRAAAADTFQRPYSDYLSTFYKGQSGERSFAQSKDFANKQKETANLAMGDVSVSTGGEKKSTKFTKKTTKYFAASYSDQARKKRRLFATV
jgi:hypothetical protein